MKVDIRYRPAYALAMVTLDPQETIQVEGGAMVGMSANMKMETGATGGFLKSLSRKMFGGESFFLNTYTGVHEGDSVALAPPLPGDIEVIEMQGETFMVQSGAYLASSAGINVETKWSGAKTFFGSEGLDHAQNQRQRKINRQQLWCYSRDRAGCRPKVCCRYRTPGYL